MTSTRAIVLASAFAAALAATTRAEANPIAVCYPEGEATVTGQTVDLAFVVGTDGPGGKSAIYRGPKGTEIGPGKPGSVEVEITNTKSSTADMGSGVGPVNIYEVTESCVPVGDWDYRLIFGAGEDYCGGIAATVATTDPSCAGTGGSGAAGGASAGGQAGAPVGKEPATDDGGGGCALNGGGGAAGAGLLGILLMLGLCRRRSGC
jgi:hypothetical protein